MSFLKLILPLSATNRKHLNNIRLFLEKDDLKKVKKMLKLGKIGVSYSSLKISNKIAQDQAFPVFNTAVEDKEIIEVAKSFSSLIEEKVRERKYEEFAKIAGKKIKEFIAPHIVGMGEAKEASTLLLFATDKVHILLLGDPSNGKTDILRAVSDLAPISAFGLGSGVSSAGLTATIKGKEVMKGLLPMADEGICCIDELNLMKTKDRGSLLNAMEKGFVTYDKGSKHVKFDARVSILATANPTGDQFVGRTIDTFKKQIPFDPALLTRFHLVFFIRRPGTEEFMHITQKIVSENQKKMELNDALFIRDYVEFSHLIDVKFDDKMKKQLVDFVAKLKQDENKFIVDVSPRVVIGLMRFAKASARLELRNSVIQEDLDKVFKIFENALYVRK